MTNNFWHIFYSIIASVAIATSFALLSTLGLASAASAPSNVLASANVLYTLYTSVSPNAINLGNVNPNSNMPTNNMITVSDINGNIGANVFIEGTNFVYGSNSIYISNTLWSPTSNTAYVGTPLTLSYADTAIHINAPTQTTTSQSAPIYFGFNIPGGTPAGTYTQTITFQNENVTYSVNALTTANVVVTANVQQVCYITLSTNSINFGQIPAAGNTGYTANGIVDYDQGGNVAANILVEGTNWNEVSPVTGNSFGVSNTVWGTSNTVAYSAGTPLGNTLADTNIQIPAPTQTTPTTSNNIYFGLGIPGGTPAGVYQQTITIENSC
jgi:hypothetical protein